MMDKMYRLNLQYFNDSDNNDDDSNVKENPVPGDSGKEDKTFTQDELNTILSKRLEREQKRIKEEIDKEYRLKAMSEEERQKAEYEELRKELEDYKHKTFIAEQKDTASKVLKAKGVPSDFADYLIGKDEEETSSKARVFAEVWEAKLNETVKTRLGKQTPSSPKTPTPSNEDDKIMSAFDKVFK